MAGIYSPLFQELRSLAATAAAGTPNTQHFSDVFLVEIRHPRLTAGINSFKRTMRMLGRVTDIDPPGGPSPFPNGSATLKEWAFTYDPDRHKAIGIVIVGRAPGIASVETGIQQTGVGATGRNSIARTYLHHVRGRIMSAFAAMVPPIHHGRIEVKYFVGSGEFIAGLLSTRQVVRQGPVHSLNDKGWEYRRQQLLDSNGFDNYYESAGGEGNRFTAPKVRHVMLWLHCIVGAY